MGVVKFEIYIVYKPDAKEHKDEGQDKKISLQERYLVVVDVEVEVDVVLEVDVVVEVDVEATAEAASGLLPPDLKTSPVGKITAHVMPPKSTNKNATKIIIRFFDHHDVLTIIRGGSAYSISV